MILDGVKKQKPNRFENHFQELIGQEEHYSRWIEHPSSSILHHGKSCCEEARLWFLSYARSMEGGVSSQYQMRPPTWLSQVFEWGPSVWPISWCQVFQEKTIDCGVFAALSREVFTAQGFEVHPAQALISYNQTCTDHWKDLWETGLRNLESHQSGDVFPWVGDQIVYHEICLLEMPEEKARIFDSTFGYWFEPQQRVGFGALLSIRSECPRILEWGDKVLSYGEWVDL